MIILESQAQAYRDCGYLKVDGFLPSSILDSYKSGLIKLIVALGEEHGLSIDCESSLDDAYEQLCNFDRSLGGAIYDHAKGLPEFHSLIASAEMQAVIRKLIDRPVIQVAHSQCVFRIDRSKEDKYGFGWHQDYWYNCLTANAITAWIPLTDVDQTMGPLEVVPGSHLTLLPVIVQDRENSNGNMARVFKMPEHTIINEECISKIPMRAGDALFFHSHLIHRSGRNRSNKSRWTIQYRYADFLDKDYTARAWVHGTYRGKVTFCDIHPELMLPK